MPFIAPLRTEGTITVGATVVPVVSTGVVVVADADHENFVAFINAEPAVTLLSTLPAAWGADYPQWVPTG